MLSPIYTYDAETTQLSSTASKQRVVCAQQRDVTMLTTSLRCRQQSRQLWGVYMIQQTSSKLPANVFKIHVLMLDVCCHML